MGIGTLAVPSYCCNLACANLVNQIENAMGRLSLRYNEVMMNVFLHGSRLRKDMAAVLILLVAAWMAMAGCAYDQGADLSAKAGSGVAVESIPDVPEEEAVGGNLEALAVTPSVHTQLPLEPETAIDYRTAVNFDRSVQSSPTPTTAIIEVRPGQKVNLNLDETLMIGPKTEKRQFEPISGIVDTQIEVEQTDDQAMIRITMSNLSGEDLKLTHSSGQQYDIWVYDAQGNVVYQWSKDYAFVQMIIDWELAAGESISYQETWDYTNNAGERLPPGTYVAKAVVLAGLQSGEAIDANQLMAATEIIIQPPELSDETGGKQVNG